MPPQPSAEFPPQTSSGGSGSGTTTNRQQLHIQQQREIRRRRQRRSAAVAARRRMSVAATNPNILPWTGSSEQHGDPLWRRNSYGELNNTNERQCSPSRADCDEEITLGKEEEGGDDDLDGEVRLGDANNIEVEKQEVGRIHNKEIQTTKRNRNSVYFYVLHTYVDQIAICRHALTTDNYIHKYEQTIHTHLQTNRVIEDM